VSQRSSDIGRMGEGEEGEEGRAEGAEEERRHLLRSRRRLRERLIRQHAQVSNVLVALVLALEEDLTLREVPFDVLLLASDGTLVVRLLSLTLLTLLLEVGDGLGELFGFGVDFCEQGSW
jgi:hypothetical protein